MVKSSLGGEVYACSKMLGRMPMLRKFNGRFLDLPPGIAGLEDCESLFTHLEKKKMIAEKFSVRRFVAMQQALAIQVLGNVYWIPGRENPADGLTKLQRKNPPLLRLLESRTYNPGYLRPLKGGALRGP